MDKHYVRIRSIEKVTHDTLGIITDKPENYNFKPGQATNIALDRKGWENEKRPFTFASLPDDDYLEFIIKTYPDHDGTTDKLLDVRAGENLILFEVFGAINYKGEGLFIAGGSGVTPFISIFRDLHKKNLTGNNKLIFANKTKADIILKDELEKILGGNFINILSEENSGEYAHGFVTGDFIRKAAGNSNGYFYLCGPPMMMMTVQGHLLKGMNVTKDRIVKEMF